MSNFTAKVDTLRKLMDDLGDNHIDVLKVDIEGAEHRVIEYFVADGVRPVVLCVEFDQPVPLRSNAAVHSATPAVRIPPPSHRGLELHVRVSHQLGARREFVVRSSGRYVAQSFSVMLLCSVAD